MYLGTFASVRKLPLTISVEFSSRKKNGVFVRAFCCCCAGSALGMGEGGTSGGIDTVDGGVLGAAPWKLLVLVVKGEVVAASAGDAGLDCPGEGFLLGAGVGALFAG